MSDQLIQRMARALGIEFRTVKQTGEEVLEAIKTLKSREPDAPIDKVKFLQDVGAALRKAEEDISPTAWKAAFVEVEAVIDRL